MNATDRTFRRKRPSSAVAAIAGLLLSLAIMGCDQDAQTVFRQTVAGDIGVGIKEFLGGNSEQGTTTILNAAVDGVVASVQQAGRGPSSDK